MSLALQAVSAVTAAVLQLASNSPNPPLATLLDHPLFRDGTCHVLDYSAASLTKVEIANYQPYGRLNKLDIFCIGDTISINQPLRSNGGDIIIYASKLELNAPVDTRSYFELKNGINHFAPPDYINLVTPPQRRWDFGSSYLDIYFEYYSLCIECISVGPSLLAPEYPAGLTPATWQGAGNHDQVDPWIRNGFPPPSLDKSTTHSGDITLFVSDYSISPNLLSGKTGSSDLCAPESERAHPFALNAAGIRGGRGGLGVPPPCLGMRAGNFRCGDNLYEQRGSSGPGGPGGDAGSIAIFQIADHGNIEFAKALLTASTVAGGEPGPTKRRWVPEAGKGPGNWGSGGYVPVCRLEQGGDWPVAAVGLPGKVQTGILSTTQALTTLAALLRARDARSDFDFGALLVRAADNDALFTEKSFVFLEARLTDAALEAQGRAALMIDAELSGQESPPNTLLWPSLVRLDAQAIENSIQLPPATVAALVQLSVVDTPTTSEAGLKHFFHRIGGAFNVDDPYAYQRFLQEATRIDLGRQLKYDVSGLQELNRISEHVAELMIFTERQALMNQLQALRTALTEVEAAAKQQTGSGLVTLIQLLGQAGSVIGGFMATLQAGDASGTATKLPDTIRALQSVIATLAAQSPNDSGVQLRKAIEGLREEIEVFDRTAARIRDDVLRRQSRYLSYGLYERESYRSKLGARVGLVPELLRVTLLSLVADPAKNLINARLNAIGVWNFTMNFPAIEPTFRFRQIVNSSEPRLTRFRKAKDWRVVLVFMPGTKRWKVPAYVLAPSEKAVWLPLYGLDYRIEKTTPMPMLSITYGTKRE